MRSEFFRNVLTLMTGTTIAQAIPIAISPILTRIYSPDEFGLFALYMAVVIVISVVATGRYELAVMLPKSKDEARVLVLLALIIAMMVSLILLLLVFLFKVEIANLLNNPEIESWLYLIPLSVFFSGVYQSFNYWNNRNKSYKILAKSRIVQSSSVATAQVSGSLINVGGGGLIMGHVIGQGIVGGYLAKLFIGNNYSLFKNISLLQLKYVSIRYKKFPLINIWAGLLNTSSVHLPVVLLSLFLGSAVTGFFSLAQRILLLPLSLIGTSIGQVYYQKISILTDNPNEIRKTTLCLYKKLLMIGIIPIIVIILYGEYIFSIVFGKDWHVAGIYAKYLSVWIYFVFASSPLSNLMTVLEKHEHSLYFNGILFFSRVAVIYYGIAVYGNAIDTLLLYGITGAVLWSGFSLYLMSLAGISYRETLRYTAPYLFILLLAFIVSSYFI